jgi:hypothetical protein
MLRRVNKEIAELKLIYLDVEFNLIKKSDTIYDLECNFPDNKLNIELSINYPFKGPKMLINGDNFFNIIKHFDENIIKKKYGYNCFCCQSYLCSKNWIPSIRLNQVIIQTFDLVNKKKALDIK